MDETVLVKYKGRELTVTKEVADYLKKSAHEIATGNRRHRDHAADGRYFDPYNSLDPKHVGGRNYLLNVVIRGERADAVRNAVSQLSDDMQRLYHLRYEEDLTQQTIADMEGVSKMAICKRQKKLHEQVKEALPDWPQEDFMV